MCPENNVCKKYTKIVVKLQVIWFLQIFQVF